MRLFWMNVGSVPRPPIPAAVDGKLLSANRLASGGFELESAGAALTTARAYAPVPGLVARALVRHAKERADDLIGLRTLWVEDDSSGTGTSGATSGTPESPSSTAPVGGTIRRPTGRVKCPRSG
ncbi:hypothetical protein GCM10009809_33000 [Isoptericola hypogeus]|uniref:Uncharacterized protein n=1 Tax=Isoptericola hypogeus TaxID=300179 RepID=A0ABN2JQ78_9MICO